MREIEVSRLTEVIEKLCIEANEHLRTECEGCYQNLPCLRGRRDRKRCP